MPKTLRSPRQRRLAELLVEHRQAAGLSQADLAARLGRYQSVVAAMEGGGRRVDVVELLDLAEALGFDPRAVVDELRALPGQLQRREAPPRS